MKNKFLTLLAITTVIASCANKGNISGGLKDETPPKLFHVEPSSESKNTKPKTLHFEFDENIKLKDIRKNLLISPVLKNFPKIEESNKGFTLYLPDTLAENTTYSFNFGNAITDLNEGNTLAGFQYVFSTGSEIDKGKLTGLVHNIEGEQLEKKENVWAILYKNLSDTSVTTLTPNYIAPINEEGLFKFNYIANGEYNIYIVKDNNSNYFYDLDNEMIGFTNNKITIKDSSIVELKHPFTIFEEKEESEYIKVIDNKNNSFSIVGKQPINEYTITDSLQQYQKLVKTIEKQDSIVVYLNEESKINKLYIKNKKEEIDTFTINSFKQSRVDTLLKSKVINKDFNPRKPLELEFNAPIKINNVKDKIELLEDSLYVAGGLDIKQVENKPKNVLISHNWNYGSNYKIQIADSVFQSIYGPVNDTLEIDYEIPKEDEFSSLKVELGEERPKHNIILELYNGDELVQEDILTRETNELLYEKLYPATYKFKVIYDENNNGIWDTGSLKEKKQPEKILWYNENIKVLRNWEVEATIDFKEQE